MHPATADRRRRAPRGFTLIEIMAITVLLTVMLLMLPPRLDGFGSRAKLESGANTLLSSFTGAREQAIIDGREVYLQFELGQVRDRRKPGRLRFLVFNRVVENASTRAEQGTTESPRPAASEQDELVPTAWRDLPEGVILTGFSIDREQWSHSNPGDEPFSVRYLADGSVRPACALRVESVDLPPDAQRTMTVLVNALTGRATLTEGEADLPPSRDASEFK